MIDFEQLNRNMHYLFSGQAFRDLAEDRLAEVNSRPYKIGFEASVRVCLVKARIDTLLDRPRLIIHRFRTGWHEARH